MYIYIYIYVYIYTHTHAYGPAYTYVHMWAHIHIYVHIAKREPSCTCGISRTRFASRSSRPTNKGGMSSGRRLAGAATPLLCAAPRTPAFSSGIATPVFVPPHPPMRFDSYMYICLRMCVYMYVCISYVYMSYMCMNTYVNKRLGCRV